MCNQIVGVKLNYEEFPIAQFFTKVSTEKEAIELVWRYKFDGYKCPKCNEVILPTQKSSRDCECKAVDTSTDLEWVLYFKTLKFLCSTGLEQYI